MSEDAFMSGKAKRDSEELYIQNQFKTPVWTGHYNQDEGDEHNLESMGKSDY